MDKKELLSRQMLERLELMLPSLRSTLLLAYELERGHGKNIKQVHKTRGIIADLKVSLASIERAVFITKRIALYEKEKTSGAPLFDFYHTQVDKE